jgi:RNA recognition motif-containing protein
MSLFVGNISRNVGASDFEHEFERMGPCTVNFKGSFAFVEFKDEKDAEEAINSLNSKDIGG